MRRAALQSFPVLHHGFDGISVQSTGKTFRLALHALHYGHGHILFGKIGIHFQHQFGTFLGFFTRGMCRMSFLPQELGRTEEKSGTHFPAHHIAPLVAKDGQVAVALNPVFISIPNDSLGSRTDDQLLFKFGSRVYHHTGLVLVGLQAIVRHHGTFLGKSFHMFGFFTQKRFRNQQREISVLHAGLLEFIIQHTLHLLPNGITIRLYHHTSSYIRLFGQIGFHHQFVIP